jgi:hypothetical protein
MHQAHKMLINQASLIRSVFPPGLDLADFQGRARQRSDTAGAPDVLNFLQNHVSKLNMVLQGQPGAPQLDPPASEPEKEVSPTPKKATTAQLQESIADLVGAQGGSHCMIRIHRLFTSTPCVEATNRKHIHISVYDLPPDHVS